MDISESILIIVPHPDDEVLLTAGVVRRAVVEGKKIAVAVLTNGDYLCKDYSKGRLRLQESLCALQSLGMQEKDIYFFGYPDTGMDRDSSFLMSLWRTKDEQQIFASACSSQTYGIEGQKQEYSFSRTGHHASYNRRSFQEDLRALLNQVRPTLVVTTSEWDRHGDHAALSCFVRQALRETCKANKADASVLWEGLVHSPAGDLVWPQPLNPAANFAEIPQLAQCTNLAWDERISVALPTEMLADKVEDNLKYKAILHYKTALNPDEPEVVEYLLSFTKKDEIFWEIKY